MRTSIVVFTRVPKTGETKTRLMTERGGILTGEEARCLYEGCLLDVINTCIKADCGQVHICYNATGEAAYLEQLLEKTIDRSKISGIYPDQGGSFDDCMQYAADHILRSNGNSDEVSAVIIVGGDIPTLQPSIVQDAVKKLHRLATDNYRSQPGKALVEGACQEGGFSLVGFTSCTPFDFKGVFYNPDAITALDMLVAKVEGNAIPLGVVEAVPDVDIPVDLASMIPVVKALRAASAYDPTILVPVNTLRVLDEIGLESTAPPHQR